MGLAINAAGVIRLKRRSADTSYHDGLGCSYGPAAGETELFESSDRSDRYGRSWRKAVIGNVGYQHALVLPTEKRLSPRKNNIEIQHAAIGFIFRSHRLRD